MIDDTIPRPVVTQETYVRWTGISCAIGAWLMTQLSPKVLTLVINSSDAKEYADEAFATIKKLALRNDHVLARTTSVEALMTDRQRYPTVKAFVESFYDKVTICNNLGLGITPYFSLQWLIHHLRDDLPVWLEIYESTLPRDAAAKLTEDDLHRFINTASEKGREAELYHASNLHAAVKTNTR
ncbi:hypothetical protein BDV26DRAFT_294839 [Aspergillus bertholletiae]|uniref:Uncharacterized protein n=1 Tax=Aspergillus bertholletiae TaxID=1226010 RepID=A0A5N7B207_9EURO|nr:hypothetical protein BDV26DRAFT_294839 [Aspergillus bertholletiae]